MEYWIFWDMRKPFWYVTRCFRLHVLAAAFVLIIDCGNTLHLKSCTSVPTRSVDVHCYVSTPFISFIMQVAESAGVHTVSRVLCNNAVAWKLELLK